MQSGPLQSRRAVSPFTSVSRLFLCLLLVSPSLAQAADLDGGSAVELEGNDLEIPASERSSLDPSYQPEFSPFGRSIIGRAPPGVTGLLDNVRENRNVLPGTVQPFVFESARIWPRSTDTTLVRPRGFNETWAPQLTGADELDVTPIDGDEGNELRRRQRRSKTIYISATSCLQPQRRPNNTEHDPPQLTLFVSTDPDNQTPGPDVRMSQQEFKPFDEGAVTWQVNATGDVFFSISAPTTHEGWFDGSWNFDVAVSTDQFYHTYDESPSAVLWVESDSTAALLQTPNLTDTSDAKKIQQIMSAGPQYVMFVENKQGWATKGVRHSMCGLSNYAQMAAKTSGHFGEKATTIMTTRGPGGLPKQQFHFNGLNASSEYWGILAHVGVPSRKRQFENRAGGGGQVFQAVQFETKTGDNCKIITELSFCNETEYAVPANDGRINTTALAAFYDDYAREMYENFEKQMAQVACNVSAEQRYSLVRDCDDCRASYKKWLCSVTIPRCEDFSEGDTVTSFVRNVGQPFPNGTLLDQDVRDLFNGTAHNRSRIARIDEVVAPGPYREILPCEDLCYDLVKDCPASLKFSCPKKSHGERFEASYQVRGSASELTCNYPGAVRNPSAASGLLASWMLLTAGVSVALGWLA